MSTVPKSSIRQDNSDETTTEQEKFCYDNFNLRTHNELEAEYYRNLGDVVGRVSTTDKLGILGNFNTSVGSDNELYGPALDKFGKRRCNSNGELLQNFCPHFGLAVQTHISISQMHLFYLGPSAT